MTSQGGDVDDEFDNRLTIGGTPEARYWVEVERGPRSGEWVSSGQAGPPVSVSVGPGGINLYGSGVAVTRTLRPGEARWLATRILESLGVYEATFGGDGSKPGDNRRARPPLRALSPTADVGAKQYSCGGCGRSSENAGAISIHVKTCKQNLSGTVLRPDSR